MYAKSGLTYLPKKDNIGTEDTYYTMVESILAESSGKPEYFVIISGGSDVYGPENDKYFEVYADFEIAVAILKVANRLWYQRIPCLFVYGMSGYIFKYTGKKAVVFDRRCDRVLKLTSRMLDAGYLTQTNRLVAGSMELQSLRDNIVDGFGPAQGRTNILPMRPR